MPRPWAGTDKGPPATEGVRGSVDVSKALGAPQGSEPEPQFCTQPRQHPAQATFAGDTYLTCSRVLHTWVLFPDTRGKQAFSKEITVVFLGGGA